MKPKSLTGLLPTEISDLIPGNKEKYRGRQIFRWIHEHGASSFGEMTNLSKSFREEIAGLFTIGTLKKLDVISSVDGVTDKYLWELSNGNHLESVIIRDDDRVTACISSQAGCKMKCSFCRTGMMGFNYNLSCGEIVEQLIRMRVIFRKSGEDITNIVFMGMGEPLDNLEPVLKAIRIINMETGLSFGQRKITVSTCGIVPGIHRLADEYKNIGLAVSLNAADNALRSKLMPVNNRYPLEELLKAVHYYVKKTKRRITYEYILIDGVNDSPAHARKLLTIARKIPCKINLIVFNEFGDSPFKQPPREKTDAFQRILIDGNITVLIRKSKGTDILAACGQLASVKYEE